ncbi:uncharacterized protein BDR25DRAFT_343534 [Lindgomyces ingoldianus]|uniref:Uncharacterized protein n=1 Tax=Lindgomyces ingoldianus TaxID=673940 RepID=A0ACB6QTM1_9PLEO|nr:uncharacterized protein BDR25DRAFT_343534 [Lindgomyces ingoldianus]KAF2469870.1 hypothetical protein BDR25DRAFT_343534 [Lindgomyces ingoldianus]
MDPRKKRSSHRLSSLFSSSSAPDHQDMGSAASSDSSGRLSKAVKSRVSSAQHLAPTYPPPPVPDYAFLKQPTITPVKPAPAALQPPPPLSSPDSRSASPAHSDLNSRPGTPDNGSSRLTPADGLKKLKRRSRLFGGGQSSDEQVNVSGQGPLAWVVGHRGKVPYNLAMLLNGEKVPELWDEQGDTFIYLFPRSHGKGPSFRVDSSVYAASQYLTRLAHGRLYSDSIPTQNQLIDRTLRNSSAGNHPPSRTASPDPAFPEGSSDGSKGSRTLSDATEDDHSEIHIVLPIALSTDNSPVAATGKEPRLTAKDIDTLVAYRNFFAFLIGQSLVATERHPGIFEIFMRIADILQSYHFSNVDGSTYGEVAASSFDSYVEELNLADVRSSREKTVEAIVLGEHMRSMGLYTEGFVHGVGKWEDIKALEHPKMQSISHKTLNRMGRASMDLDNRVKNINVKLGNFDFPALFSGLMNSDTSDERKVVKFKSWRTAFMGTRSFVHDYYKSKYGSWIPKARSKKNDLTTSGLNRLVLRDIYDDMSNLYDLLVDRTNLTTRTADGFTTEDEATDFEAVAYRALRRVMSEYDRSTPPVQPPIPFDLPMYPSLKGFRKDYPSGDAKKDTKARNKKLKGDEMVAMVRQSHNLDSERQTSFLDAFRKFELKQASGKTMEELWELRTGQWLFLYAVLQSLPMLAVDAPGVRFADGVEYFLCEPPKSGVPWGRDDTNQTRTWFGVAGGSQVVNLPAHIVEHGVEGIYRRSHCWKMADVWSQNDAVLNAAVHESMDAAPLPPPPSLLTPNSAVRSRSQSPDRRRESVMNLGLEALPLPAGVAPASSPAMRPKSSNDPNKTFDAILSSSNLPEQKNGKKKK